MTTTGSAEKKRCFVISPIGQPDSDERKRADKTLRHLIRKALDEEYTISRADEDVNPGAITPALIAAILEADLIVADLTGANANVFYELAIAHGYLKPVIHIQRSGEKPPFDVKDMRLIPYDMDPDELERAQRQLREYAKFATANPERIETPLTSAQRFKDVEESTDPVAESNVRVMAAIGQLSRDVTRAIEARPAFIPSSESERELGQRRADTRSLAKFVERIVSDGRAESYDFESMITQETSPGFDYWVRKQFERAGGSPRENEQNQILFAMELQEVDPNQSEFDFEHYEPDPELHE